MFKKLIVGVDFSGTSERAVRTAVALGAQLGGEVVLVHVLARPDGAEAGSIDVELRGGIEQRLRELCARHAAPGVKLDWGVVDGRPADEIATFAQRWGGDLIVSGTTARGAVAQMLLGSVADRLVRIARVPVLVVGPESPA